MHAKTILILAAIAMMPVLASAQDDGRRTRRARVRPPNELADCLFWSRAKPGTWARYKVVMTELTKDDAANPPTRTYEMKSAIIAIPGAVEEFEWLEVAIGKPEEPPFYVVKNLINRKPLQGDAKDWLDMQKPFGWQQWFKQEPTRFTKDTILKNSPLVALFAELKPGDVRELRNETVVVKAGEFDCFRFRGTPEAGPEVTSYVNASVPFGCVRFVAETKAGGREGRLVLTLQEFGRDAKTQMPERTARDIIKGLQRPK